MFNHQSECFRSKIGQRQNCFPLSLLFNFSIRYIYFLKKDIQIGQEESKMSIVCRWHNCLLENAKNYTPKLLYLINEFNKIIGQ